MEIKDKVCIITGSARGIGRGLVEGFARRGAKVIAGTRQRHVTEEDDAIIRVKMDVTSEEEIHHAVQMALQRHGRIDVLINNAGIYPRQPFEKMNFEEWRRVLDINLDGTWRCCNAVVPAMIKQKSGVIINAGSIALRTGLPDLVHYEASKGGVVGLTRGLARDLGRHGIRVNCVQIGAVFTEGELELFPDQQRILQYVEEKQCIKGRITPESIEPTFAFLASDASADITGQCITADRGWVHE